MAQSDPKHVHNYVIVRREKRSDRIYVFYECVAPGNCDLRHKMEIEYT